MSEQGNPAPSDTITLIYQDVLVADGSKGIWDVASTWVTKQSSLSVERLKSGLSEFCRVFLSASSGLNQITSDFQVEKIELSVDLTATGEVRLLSSAAMEVKGGIKLIFSRRS